MVARLPNGQLILSRRLRQSGRPDESAEKEGREEEEEAAVAAGVIYGQQQCRAVASSVRKWRRWGSIRKEEEKEEEKQGSRGCRVVFTDDVMFYSPQSALFLLRN